METVATTTRLLPVDRTPGLRLSRFFNRQHPPGEVEFDRPSPVVLWNAVCVGRLPAVGEIVELAAAQDVPCHRVAAMVRDVERTAAAAAQGCKKALLTLEERPAHPSGLARGWVTRRWLEATRRAFGIPR